MLFGKIDYINLLPFYLFVKRTVKNSQFKQSMHYQKDFPTAINRKFKRRSIDAAFISSIQSKRGNFRCTSSGIIAKKEIRSVLLRRGKFKADSHSASSNRLAKKLGLEGEVIIGDKALRAYHQNPDAYLDLAQMWHEKYHTPFVFARLCINRHYHFYHTLSKRFLRARSRIPYYILQRYAASRSLTPNQIRSYLKLVSYEIDPKAMRGLKRFLG